MIFYILLFILGLAFGSFFNVLILRYDPEGSLFNFKRLSGRSHCPHCSKELKPSELIPVLSFIFLGGRCSSCGERISFFYPFTEILTGLFFALVPFLINNFYGVPESTFLTGGAPSWYYLLVFLWLIISLTFLLVALIDFKYYVVPDELNLILFLVGIFVSFLIFFHPNSPAPFRTSFFENYILIFSPFENVLWNHLLGSLIGGIFFLLLVVLSRGKGMGFGDVKLALASGMALGWPDMGLAVAISFIAGGFFGALLLLLKTKGMKDKIPYAPFFVLGVFLTMFLGHSIIFGYFKLFGF